MATHEEVKTFKSICPQGAIVIDMTDCHGLAIVLEKPADDVDKYLSGHFISDLSNLYEPTTENTRAIDEADIAIHNAKIEGLERTILALACSNYDMTTPAMYEAIETVIDGIGNGELIMSPPIKMATTHKYIIKREILEKESTFAIVTLTVQPEKFNDDRILIWNAFVACVTKWLKDTDDGRDAYKNSTEDFNIADLWEECPINGDLEGILLENDIHKCEIVCHSDYEPVDWTYDQHFRVD